MTVGNQLSFSLSLLARQSMLMLTEKPEIVTVFERFFQLEYSESYTCNMHGDARIEGYHYCMPLETLLALNYNSFILIVGITVVHSHARDMYGNSNLVRCVNIVLKVTYTCTVNNHLIDIRPYDERFFGFRHRFRSDILWIVI